MQEWMPTMAHGGAFLPWALIVYGITLVVTGAKITAPFRAWVERRSKFFGKLLCCPMCFGWYVGLAIGFSPYSFTRFPLTDAFAACAWCWTCHVILSALGAEKL